MKSTIILWLISCLHVLLNKFTKVEESFNIQAIHDILTFNTNLKEYDHHVFPGVVPRTFTGPLLISIVSYPFVYIATILQFDKLLQQMIVRIILATFSILSINHLLKSVKFIRNIEYYFVILTISQFHLLFYISRSLPNVFAFVLTTFAFSYYIRKQYYRFILLAGTSILIYRSELSILFGCMLLKCLITRKIKLLKSIGFILISTIVILSLTIPIDSYFWNRLCWPEAETFYYNVILNKSSNWGTSPWAWYFYSVLLRCLLTALPLVAANFCVKSKAGTSTKVIQELCVFCVLYIAIYSFLPHKELRFIIYTFPIFNLSAAEFWSKIQQNLKTTPSRLYKYINVACYCAVIINIIATAAFTIAATFNYPGGTALSRFNQIPDLQNEPVHLYVCNYAAQTGVSRFLHQHSNWIYNKTENIEHLPQEMYRFSHLILESSRFVEFHQMMKQYPLSTSYKIMFQVNRFGGIQWKFPFIRFERGLTVVRKVSI